MHSEIHISLDFELELGDKLLNSAKQAEGCHQEPNV